MKNRSKSVSEKLYVWYKRYRQTSRRKKIIRWSVVALIVLLAIFSYFTNPFVRFSLVKDPNKNVVRQGDQLVLPSEQTNVYVRDKSVHRDLASLKAAWHIVSSKFVGGPKAKQADVDEIIREIHELRFDPGNPFLISGDHFSVLYPRSLGIFYHSLMDSRTALDENDWERRQKIYLKTTAYALEVFSQSDRLSTTIVPVGPASVALINIYAPPSDTLYSLLYALDTMQSPQFLQENYPFEVETPVFPLYTSSASAQLIAKYSPALENHWNRYSEMVYDPETGLVRSDISLSGTKDIVDRQSALYDNVIFWRTAQLAQKLGIIEQDQVFLDDLRQRIIKTYWNSQEGFFVEDGSVKAREERLYSSDWIIMFQTGFLTPQNPEDLVYLRKSVNYIQRNAIDQPFGLQYQSDRRDYQLYPLVRFGAPEYGSTAIWSNWGMEYAKLLIRLAQVTGDELYLQQADRQLAAYTYNIKRYRGYPEVYDQDGDFFRKFFYKSIRQTGWVVTYEEARAMYTWTRDNWSAQVIGSSVD